MTYNRCGMLRQCLDGIRAQTMPPATILVLDNASTDGTARMLAEMFPDVQVRRMAENLGCTGAMHEVLKHALTFAPDYIWFFDDDAVPYPSCLETLVREMQALEGDRRVGVLRVHMRDPVTGDVSGGGVSTASLLRAEMVSRVDLPRSDLFMESSDHSYNAQIRKAGYEILRVPVVLVQHPVRRPKTVRQIIAGGYRVSPWRLYYAVRNELYLDLYVQRSFRDFLRHLALAARTLVLLTLFGRPRRGQLFVVRGIVDGMLGRTGRRVEPAY